MTNPDKPCPHLNFDAQVTVGRIGEAETADGLPRAYMAEVRVSCADCGEPFRWRGVKAGLSFGRPTCSVDEATLNAPMRPASSDPDFGLGIPGFAIGYRSGPAS